MAINVRLDLSPDTIAFITRVEKAFGGERLRRDLVVFVRRQSLLAAGHVIRTQLSGQALARRTGQLARSVEGRVDDRRGRLPGLRVGVFTGPATAYAAVQEFGTKGKNPASPIPTIEPVTADALAIPVGDSLTGAGVAKFEGPRADPRDLVFIPFKRNQIVVGALFERNRIRRAQARSRGDFSLRDVQAAYLLMTEVDIEPTFWLTRGLNEYFPIYIEALLDFLEQFIQSGAK